VPARSLRSLAVPARNSPGFRNSCEPIESFPDNRRARIFGSLRSIAPNAPHNALAHAHRSKPHGAQFMNAGVKSSI